MYSHLESGGFIFDATV